MTRTLRLVLAGTALGGMAAVAALTLPVTAVSQETASPAAAPLDVQAALADRVLGNPDAPFTLVEYASLTCGHCATFHTQFLPKLKAEFIDTGQMKLIYRDFPLDGVALTASAVARCLPQDKYFAVLNTLFRTQANWAYGKAPNEDMAKTLRIAGVSQQTFEACAKNQELRRGIVEMRKVAEDKFGVQGTPTFVLPNGTKLSATREYEDFAQALVKAGATRVATPAN